MNNNIRMHNNAGTVGKILIRTLFVIILVFMAVVLFLRAYLGTPHAAGQISRLLTSYLHQPVRVSSLTITGGALYLKGVSLANPPDFQPGNLAAADYITIAPQWSGLLLGRRSLRLVAVGGVRLDIRTNSMGVWNFSGLQRLLTAGKPSSSEMFIQEFVVTDGAFRVNGQGAEKISLQIFNLTTKGTNDSRIELAFEDSARNHYTMAGSARPGKDPALDLSLAAPAFSISGIAGMLKLKPSLLPAGGEGNLKVTAGLHDGLLRVKGALDFSHITLPSAATTTPLPGKLALVADYNLKTDAARLETLSLTLNKVVKVQAVGTATNLRHERNFNVDIAIDEVDLGTLAFLLPEKERRTSHIGGRLGRTALHLSGNGARGVSRMSGTVTLHEGTLASGGRLYVRGVDATITLSGAGSSLRATGRLAQRSSHGAALLDTLDAPFNVTLSPQLKPLTAEIPSLSARVIGISLRGRFEFRGADGMAIISNGTFRSGETVVRVARLAGRIPAKESGRGTDRYPLGIEITGGEIRQGKGELSGLAGTLRGVLASDSGGRWLEGTADLAASRVAWQGQPVAAPAIHVAFAKAGGRGDISGTLLRGKLSGDFTFQPFAPADGGSFHVGFTQGQLAMAAGLIPKGRGVTRVAGSLEGSCSGGYSRRQGLDCRFNARGQDIVVSGSGGKSLLGKGGISLAGALSGQKIVLSDAVLTAGEAVTLKLKGAIANVLSPQRAGSVSFTLPQTSFNSIIDTFVNALPRSLQEAVVDGAVAAEGTIDLHDGRKLLEGALNLKGIRIEVPSQRFSATDIAGKLPFSVDLSGKIANRTSDTVSFTRENYPRLLEQLRQLPGSGDSVRVGKIALGPLELGTLTMQVRAGKGITEIDSLRSSLYEGAVFGKGVVAMKEGITYRWDLLIDGLSMKRLCAVFPKIKDYISGRLDGVISLNGTGKGMAGLSGFTDLWAREGSGERMLVSKEFLQRLSGKKLSGFFFRDDRPYDQAEINAILEGGYLTFETLDIKHTNFLGVRDLSVSIAPTQNRIALDHLFNAISQAAVRGKAATGAVSPAEAPVEPEFKWQE